MRRVVTVLGVWGWFAAYAIAMDGSVLKIGDVATCVACNILPPIDTKTFSTVFADPLDGGCTNESTSPDVINGDSFSGKAVIFQRGNCTFNEMAAVTKGFNGSAVFVVNSDLKPKIAPGGVNDSMFVCMLDNQDAPFLTKDPQVQLQFYDYPPVDVSAAGFVFLALFAIVTGSMLGTEDERKRAFGDEVRSSIAASNQTNEVNEEHELTYKKIALFVVFASIFLMLLYFLFDYLVYILYAFFVLLGTLSLHLLTCETVSHTSLWRNYTVNLPYSKDTPILALAILAVSATVSIVWFVERHSGFSWILQDLMGVAVLIIIVKLVPIPNMKIGTILLMALLVYDVFFVFITPLLTKNNDSVMVHAATGSSTRADPDGCIEPAEMMPFLLRIPRMYTPKCRCARDSMLGFGDIAFPGWLVALCVRMDCYRALSKKGKSGVRYAFTIVGGISYLIGLICAFLAAGFMNTAQPALLYLSPSTLIGVWGAAWYYGLLPDIANLSKRMKELRRPSNLAIQDGDHQSPDGGATRQRKGSRWEDTEPLLPE